jgi:hypothetical protein
MLPLIRDGSHITVASVRPEELAPGDIIVFRDGGLLIAHRLIQIKSGGDMIRLRQKGDNQLVPSWIEPTALVGKAVSLNRESDSRRLDVDTRSLRIRILTACGRVEGNAVDAYLKIAPPARSILKWLLVPLAAIAWPIRRLIYSLLITVYPREKRPEPEEAIRFLVACFRGGTGSVSHWKSVLAVFGRHGLIPLAAPIASTSGAPPDIAEALKRHTYRAAMVHNSALAVLDELNRVFRNAALDCAVLKGAHLYESLYKDLFPRDYEDIDLLVRPGDVDRALPLLAAAGYQPVGGRAVQWFLRHGHFHIALESDKPARPRIELHWSLVDRVNLCRIPGAGILARATEFRADNKVFQVLSPEDTLIYLCLHAAKHGVLNFLGLRQGRPAEWFCGRSTGNRLLWFMDIELLLKKEMERLDWAAVATRIRDWNVEDEVSECLRVLCVLNPGSAAGRALEKLGLPANETRGSSVSVTLFGTPTAQRMLEAGMRMNPALLFRPARILLVGRVLFPSPDRIRKFYGASGRRIVPLLYLVHPWVLLFRLFR